MDSDNKYEPIMPARTACVHNNDPVLFRRLSRIVPKRRPAQPPLEALIAKIELRTDRLVAGFKSTDRTVERLETRQTLFKPAAREPTGGQIQEP